MDESVRRPANTTLHSLQEREALWQAVLQSARDAIVSIDGSGTVTLFNEAAQEMFGYAATEVVGQNVSMLMPSPYREEHDEYLQRYYRSGEARAIGRIRRVEGRRKSGEAFPLELSVAVAKLPEGLKLFTAIIRDVSEQTRAQRELETRARQQAAVADLGRSALTLSLSETLEVAVKLVADTLGVELVKILRCESDGQLQLIAGTGWRDGLVGRARVAGAGDSQAGFTLRSGEAIIVENMATERRFHAPPLLREHGVVSGVSATIGSRAEPFGVLGAHSRQPRLFTADDANFLQSVANVLAASVGHTLAEAERRQLEMLAAEHQRLAEVGAITAKVVHDFGNPLAAISMQAQLLRRRLEQGDPTTRMIEAPVERILSTVARLDALAHELSSFARGQRLQIEAVDPTTLLAELVELWTPVATARGIDVQLTAEEKLPSLRGDRAKLHRVLENILKNALEAVATPGGRIEVRAEIVDQGQICIHIEDNGPGIDKGYDVFRLFETTKAEGSGLGLAVARQIVLAHQGSIEYRRREPAGTEFRVRLPIDGPEE